MKTRVLVFLALAAAALAQPIGNPTYIYTTTTVPTGACRNQQMWLVVPAGLLYSCQNGAPALIGFSSTWAGSSSVTTLGTITTGTWHGAQIADSYIASAATWNGKQNAISGAPGSWPSLGGLATLETSGLADGNYCVHASSGALSLVACTGGSSGGGGGSSALSWGSLTSSQWAGLTSSQWAGLTN